MPVPDLAPELSPDEHGIWRAGKTKPVSYPSEGNASTFGLEDTSYWFRHRNACLLALIRRFPAEGTFLDVGGGNGFVSKALLEAGVEAVLLEPGPAGALNAKVHRGLPDVICATLESAHLVQNSVSAVGLFDVLEHLEDDAAALAALSLALKDRGLFFGTVPAHGWLWSTADEHAGHHRRYTQESLRELFEGNGYELLYSSYFFRPLLLPIFVLRALPFRLGLTKAELSNETEHGSSGGLVTRLLCRLLASELKQIEAGESLSQGASLLFVARLRASS